MTETLPDLDALADRLAGLLTSRLAAERERLIDRRELAQRIGISERAIGAMSARGELPAGYLIGGVRRWNWHDVIKHLETKLGRRPRKGRGKYSRD